MKKTFSESLRFAIESSGVSLRELGRRAEVNVSVLSRFVRGDRPAIDTSTVDKLWAALGLKVCESDVKPVDSADDARLRIACAIYTAGPTSAVAIAAKLSIGRRAVATILEEYDWFVEEADGWHITEKARAAVVRAGK